VIHHTTKADKPATKQADKNAKKLKIIAEKRHCRNPKMLTVLIKSLENIALDPRPLGSMPEAGKPWPLFSN
jgi:hypothetical protein